ncbi:3-beta hydroxysteroid dehydrogenase/isomerase family-domain-containing protein [Pyronema domesticum]|uniref:Similar to Sterol-4-alpha-carboxylate 3-dehydrogenase, decarboxylating acc. no. O43050 n=1 Tax=Pyronema omphalodes (strain CBS 100304) TaxID=1076935 RepID=U4LFA4_PYROM|nr:3-beta hydroxysteroid dehydrogenase/isomerase family-domain-containing protein [Pyronema domesticum]CCX13659.1 Similar to Sterol-4-alpha-carboxylate 3-dehydrogenase, decarboxylating; acc. no. O43050 [Pyronema omphalodes CBS 100304]
MSTEKPKTTLKSALVIGGCGFLGHHVVKILQVYHPETKISVLDLRTNVNRREGVTYYDGDITSRESVDAVLAKEKPETVIDTVSPVHGLGKDIYFKVNVEGTRICMEASRDAGVKAFVWTSSASVLFDGESDVVNLNEKAPIPTKSLDPYTETKAIGEKMVLEANREGGMLTVALRLSGLFGEGDRQLLPGMLQVMHNNQTKFQIGDNTNLFDFTYIGNAAYAHILAAEKLIGQDPATPKSPNTCDGEAFIITNGEPVYFWDFPRAVWAQRHHYPSFYIKMPREVGVALAGAAETFAWLMRKEPGFTRFRVKFSCWNRYFDIRKAKGMLGYKPIWSLQEGLVKSLKFLEEEEKKQSEKKGQ